MNIKYFFIILIFSCVAVGNSDLPRNEDFEADSIVNLGCFTHLGAQDIGESSVMVTRENSASGCSVSHMQQINGEPHIYGGIGYLNLSQNLLFGTEKSRLEIDAILIPARFFLSKNGIGPFAHGGLLFYRSNNVFENSYPSVENHGTILLGGLGYKFKISESIHLGFEYSIMTNARGSNSSVYVSNQSAKVLIEYGFNFRRTSLFGFSRKNEKN